MYDVADVRKNACKIVEVTESMETMEEGDGRLQNGSSAKMPNRLKLVLSDENDKVTSEKTAEMDPYRELELYLAKVKVSQR